MSERACSECGAPDAAIDHLAQMVEESTAGGLVIAVVFEPSCPRCAELLDWLSATRR